jgi:hypothetical protein
MKWVVSVVSLTALALGLFSLAPAHEGHEHENWTASKSKELLVKAQKICPVSGIELGDHGAPLETKSGKQTVFVCCKGCVGKPFDAKHQKTMHANLAAAQGLCPVMKKPLPENPKSTLVKGRLVFICCPPCTKKIDADPEKYLKIVDAELSKNLAKEKKAKE